MKTITEVLQDTIIQYYKDVELSRELTTLTYIVMQAWADEQTEQLQVTNLELTQRLRKLEENISFTVSILRKTAVQMDRTEQIFKQKDILEVAETFNTISNLLRTVAKDLEPPKVKKNG